jgi:hypothetical protein
MITEFAAAIQSVKALNDLVKAARELKNFNDFVAAISEVNTKLMEAEAVALNALEKQLSLTNRIGELEKEIRELKNWDSEAKRYQLAKVGIGVFAYVLKPGMESGEPSHMLCANCFYEGQKSILQVDLSKVKFLNEYVCQRCGTHIRTFVK